MSRRHQRPSTPQSAGSGFAYIMPLEPRIMFDAAAVATADAAADHAEPSAPAPALPDSAAHHEVAFVDPTLKDSAALLQGLNHSVEVIALQQGADPLAQISDYLASHQGITALHLFSHGTPGAVRLGDTVLSADTLSEHANQLESWKQSLTADADILLYGCDVASGSGGEAFISQLALLTGADVAASTDATGGAAAGGNWVLERSTGPIEAAALALAGYDGLLADPAADATLTVSDAHPLIGEDVTLKLTFDNTGSAVGYGPFADLFINHKGADGSTTDFTKSDGLNFKSATLFGTNVDYKLYTLTTGTAGANQLQIDGSGRITHPVTGELITVPSGFGAGDQLLVITLPFGSFTPDQLTSVDVTLTVDAKADPDVVLKVASSGGFMFGKDPLDNPLTDPVIRQATVHELALTPKAFKVETFMRAPEGETATGPNFVRQVDIVITPADGTTLSDATRFQFTLPDGMVLADGFTPPAGWVVSTLPVYDASTANDTLVLTRTGGQSITSATTISVPVYVTEKYQSGADILNPATGEAAVITFAADAVRVTDGQWQGITGSTLSGAGKDTLAVNVTTTVSSLTVRSVQVINDLIYKNGSGTPMGGSDTVKPGDSLEYRLQVDVSDFFRTGSVIVTDELPDGLTFDKNYTPTLTINWKDASGTDRTTNVAFDAANVSVLSADGTTWVPLTDFTGDLVTQTATGKTIFRFDVSTQLNASGEQLVGGLVDTGDGSTQGTQNGWATGAAGTGATTATISFKALVEENYRTDDPLNTSAGITNQNLKERDVLNNKATVTVNILKRDDGATVNYTGRTDDSGEAVHLPAGSTKLEIASITRNGTVYTDVTGMTLAPGDKVTYKLTYDLPIGDYEKLEFDAYLPMPVFNLATGALAQDTAHSDTPDAGQWNFGSGTSAGITSATVTGKADNRVTFTLGNSGPVSSTAPGKVEIVFSATVTDTPMTDRLMLTAQGTHQDSSSQDTTGSTASIRQIVIGQADVHVYKGYTNKADTQTGGTTTTFTPGSAITGSTVVTIGSSNATGFDANDKVTVTIALENQGSSAKGAFNVEVKDDLDPNLTADASSLKFYKGDGTLITQVEIKSGGLWTATTVSGNEAAILAALQTGDGVRFIDGADGALGRGKGDDGSVVTNGSNIVYISYDATVKQTIAPNTNSDSKAQLTGFANAEAGDNFLGAPREESATIGFRANAVNLIITATPDHGDTAVAGNGKTADAVVGEYIDYQITITLAEATTTNGQITVSLGNGLGLVNVAGQTATGSGNIIVNYAGFGGALSTIGGTSVSGDGTVSASIGAIGANSFTVNLGDIVNTDNDTGAETITLVFRAVALNTAGNIAGATGADRRVEANFTSATSNDTDKRATVTIREPQLTATLTADKTTVTADNEVEYTLTVSNSSGYAAHDVKIEEILSAIADQYLGDLTLTQAAAITGGGTAGTITGAGIQASRIDYAIDHLDNGQIFTVKFKAQVVPGTPFGQAIKIDPTITWTSIPGDGSDRGAISNTTTDSERTGVAGDGAADGSIGTGTNTYSLRPSNTVTFATPTPLIYIDYTSHPDGTSDPYDPDRTDDDKAAASVSIGEVVRIRMVVELPESTSSNVKLTPNLPTGLSYVGNATVALVGNGPNGDITSTTVSNVHVGGSDPLLVNPSTAITRDGSGSFDLGDLNNPDRDGDKEYIVIEFDVRVDNVAGNQKGGTLNVNYTLTSGGSPATSGDVVLTIVEPELGINKAVSNVTYADTDPTVNDDATVTYTITITNNGNATAHNVSLTDSLPAGATIAGAPTVSGQSGTVTGITNNSAGGAPNYSIDTLGVGASVTVTYSVTIADRLNTPASTDAEVTWTSLPGADANERTGAGGVDDYKATDPAGFGTISGTVWDDTISQNGAIDSGEERLAGVTVTLTATSGPLNGQTLTTLTAADGSYSFGALPVGNYIITVPNDLIYAVDSGADTDTLHPRWDSDGGTGAPVGSITIIGLTEGGTSTGRNFGYLQENDAPTVTFSDTSVREFTEGVNTAGDQNVLGTPVALGTVTIADTELARGLDTYNGTTLTIARSDGGTGFAANADDVLGFDGTVTISGATIQISGTTVATFTNAGGLLIITFNGSADTAAVNTVASAITYANKSQNPGTPHNDSYNVPLRFRFNDANDSDKQGYGGALTGDATVTVKVIVQNDPPVANNDTNSVTENTDSPTSGNVITGTDRNGTVQPGQNDTDPDTPLNQLVVTGIQPADAGSATTVPTGGVTVQGKYGELTIHPDGSYTYALDETNPTVNALNDGQQLTDEVFTYTLSDGDKTDTATLTITINGKTDGAPAITPVDGNAGATGQATVHEAGLVDGDGSETTTGTITVQADAGIKSVTVGGTEITLATLKNLPPEGIAIATTNGTIMVTGFTANATYGGEVYNATISYTYTLEQAQNTPGATEGTETVNLKVTDKTDVETTGTLTIQVIDHTPTANDDTASFSKSAGTVSGNVYTNDAIGADGPAAGGPVTPKTNEAGSYGSLTLNADGSYTYTVDPANAAVLALAGGSTLTETFTYTITDGDGDTSTATLTITIIGNSPPVAHDDVRTTPEDTPVSGNVIGGGGDGDAADTDVDGDTLTVTQITINGTPTTVPADGGTVVVDIPGSGTLAIDKTGAYTFTPVPDWHGAVPVITYTVDDGAGDTDTATLTITVTPVADIADDSATTHVNEPVTTKVLDNDSFSGTPVVTVEPGDGPAHGTVTVNPDNTITYTPTPGFTGSDSYTYTVTSGGVTETAIVTVTVTNAPPVPHDDIRTTPEDTPVSGNVLTGAGDGDAADGDADNDPLTVTQITINGTPTTVPADGGTVVVDIPGSGTLAIDKTGAYTFTPNPDWNGTVPVITYTVSDGTGAANSTATATLTITVTPVVDITVDSAATHANVPVTTPVLDNDSFEGTPVVTVEPGDGPAHGTVTVNPDNTITYIPNPGFTGSDSYTYTVTSGGVTETATVTVTVTNTPPVARDDVRTTPEDTPVSGNVIGSGGSGDVADSDADNDPLTITGFTVGGTNYLPGSTAAIAGVGSVTLNTDGSYTFTPVPDWNGTVPVITYTVSDGTGAVNGTATATLTITVTPVADIVPDTVTTHAGTPVTTPVLDNDSFEGTPVVTATTPPAHGTVTVNPDNTITYTPNPGFSGSDSYTYTVTSGGVTETATVTVTVTNTPPVAADTAIVVGYNTATTDRLPVASDADGDNVTYAKGSDPAHGTVTVHPDGSYSYRPADGYNGPDSFTYTVSDGNGGMNRYTVTIIVQPPTVVEPPAVVDPAPVAPPTAPVVPGSLTPVTIVPSAPTGPSPTDWAAPPMQDLLDFGGPSYNTLPVLSSSGVVILGGSDSTVGEHGLYIVKTPSSQEVLVEQVAAFNLPTGTFRHSDASARVAIEANLADGRPLPGWLSFDPDSGRFTGKPPAGSGGAMDIKVTARDDQGNVVFTQFLLHISEEESRATHTLKNGDKGESVKPAEGQRPPAEGPVAPEADQSEPEPAAPQQNRSQAPAAGRPSLAEQLRQQQPRSRQAELLASLQRSVAARG